MKLLHSFVVLFTQNRITQASAALSYYLTMTFFPMLIIVCAFLGNSENALELLEITDTLVTPEISEFTREHISYVNQNERALMLPLGLTVLVSYASAALRSLQGTIGNIQGGAEYRGIHSFAVSFIYTLALLAFTYFAIVLMLTGRGVLEWINRFIPGLEFLFDWLYLRHILLAAILFLLLLGLYYVPKRKTDKYRVLPGALLSSFGVLIISPLVSMFMGNSVKYSLVYGSITSFILLMLWIYFCCIVVYCGAVFNVALYTTKTTDL